MGGMVKYYEPAIRNTVAFLQWDCISAMVVAFCNGMRIPCLAVLLACRGLRPSASLSTGKATQVAGDLSCLCWLRITGCHWVSLGVTGCHLGSAPLPSSLMATSAAGV